MESIIQPITQTLLTPDNLGLIITGLFSVITASIGTYAIVKTRQVKTITKELNDVETDFEFLKLALSPSVNLGSWGRIAQKIQKFCDETQIDRFLILVCWNGKHDPEKTTAIYQYRQDAEDFSAYVGVDLDSDYVERLQSMKYHGYHEIDVESIRDGLIKAIYQAEGVKKSLWFPISAHKSDKTDAFAFRYCSFATHDNRDIDLALRQKCQNLVWEIKTEMGVHNVPV